jgi:cation diffusion facilitator CzcD-associated flavoprotein CzcO
MFEPPSHEDGLEAEIPETTVEFDFVVVATGAYRIPQVCAFLYNDIGTVC